MTSKLPDPLTLSLFPLHRARYDFPSGVSISLPLSLFFSLSLTHSATIPWKNIALITVQSLRYANIWYET